MMKAAHSAFLRNGSKLSALVIGVSALKIKMTVVLFPDVNDDSVIHALKLLYPKLENQLLLAKQVALIEALKDLASHEEDTSFFAPEYLHILNNAETLMAEFKRQPAKLERLYGKIACCPPASA